MGYDTAYALRVLDANTLVESDGSEQVIEVLRDESVMAYNALQEDGCTNTEMRWLSAVEDLKTFSIRYPELVFELTGEDEALWRAFIAKGKAHQAFAKIIYPTFNPDLLEA